MGTHHRLKAAGAFGGDCASINKRSCLHSPEEGRWALEIDPTCQGDLCKISID